MGSLAGSNPGYRVLRKGARTVQELETKVAEILNNVMAGKLNQFGTKGPDVASAATIEIGTQAGLENDITGAVTIASFGTADVGVWKLVQFDGALTLTDSATFILPGGNIVTAAGDMALFVSEGAGTWRCAFYTKDSGESPATTRGTYTPTFDFATTGNLANVYTVQVGRWIKTGRLVTAWITLNWTPTHTTASGNAQFSLPFTAATGTNLNMIGTVGNTNANITWPTTTTMLAANVNSADAFCTILGSGSAIASAALTTASFPSATAKTIRITVTYEASS